MPLRNANKLDVNTAAQPAIEDSVAYFAELSRATDWKEVHSDGEFIVHSRPGHLYLLRAGLTALSADSDEAVQRLPQQTA